MPLDYFPHHQKQKETYEGRLERKKRDNKMLGQHLAESRARIEAKKKRKQQNV